VRSRALLLRGARTEPDGPLLDVLVERGTVSRVAPAGELGPREMAADLEGRLVIPALVNGHDHLDASTFPPLGRPPYASLYEWTAALENEADVRVRAALGVPLADRLFLGGLRNVLAGVAAVVHHGAHHRSLGEGFPLQVLERYQFAQAPGLTAHLKRTYRSTDRRIPWFVHAAEGTDARSAAEVALLSEQNLVRQNTVIIHGIALSEADAARLAQRNACVVWCPESERRRYGATTPVRMLRAAGVRVGLGSDSALSGARDALSNLAAARREGALSDAELLEMAGAGTAAVARLPAGAVVAGAPADLLAVDSIDALLEGRRAAVALLVVAGEAVYGLEAILGPLSPRTAAVRVDGQPRALVGPIARRAGSLLGAHPALRALPWMEGIEFDREEGR
jgi:cytosine/adenosine deaminase-related metal-dependent hydrolase